MKTWSCAAGCLAALLAFAGTVPAQDGPPRMRCEPRGVEVTPFLSLGSESSSRVGAAVRYPVTSNLSVETEVGYRRGELQALSSHVSAVYDLPGIGRVTPYLAAGIGLEQYGAPLEQPTGVVIIQPRVGLALNAGLGITVDATPDSAIRTDARWFNGIGRDTPEHWRLYNGVTFRAGGR
jgi:hypothetical protein